MAISKKIDNPQFNIKTGSDSSLFFSREVTSSDIAKGVYVGPNADTVNENLGLIKDQDNIGDVMKFSYPQRVRRTGHSIAGTTESIESQELRKGRTKSAPRKGNSSSEGSLDIELSPDSYDDIFEAALRNRWKKWTSDATSPIKFDFDKELVKDQFISNGRDQDGGLEARYLVGEQGDGKNALIEFPVDERKQFDIYELTCGTEDIKYSITSQYGGISGEDLYQEFQHNAVNTMSLSVTPGQIVTGSFGFMGTNDPALLQDGLKKATQYDSEKHYFTRAGAEEPYTYEYANPQPKTQSEIDDGEYYSLDFIDSLSTIELIDQDGRFVGEWDQDSRIATKKNPTEVANWVKDLANKVGTKTDQFTAREGFLYVNGNVVQYGSNLSIDLNNGLNRTNAIFEKNAISTSPLSLDIRGSLSVYLIANYAEKLHNMAVKDKDVEIIFAFQDKEKNPDVYYVFQILKAKFESPSLGSGAEELDDTLSFSSFEERAIRIFKLERRSVDMVDYNTEDGTITIGLSSAPETEPTSLEDCGVIKVMVEGIDRTNEINMAFGSWNASTNTITLTSDVIATSGEEVVVSVSYNKSKVSTSATIA